MAPRSTVFIIVWCLAMAAYCVSAAPGHALPSRDAQCALCKTLTSEMIEWIYHTPDYQKHHMHKKLVAASDSVDDDEFNNKENAALTPKAMLRAIAQSKPYETHHNSAHKNFHLANEHGVTDEEFAMFVTQRVLGNPSLDRLLNDIVYQPPSRRKLSYHAIGEIFVEALCQKPPLSVCDRADPKYPKVEPVGSDQDL
eukprot:PhM_4_TR13392/c0_g1_i1/m.47011